MRWDRADSDESSELLLGMLLSQYLLDYSTC